VPEDNSLSLYFDLYDGRKADLEIVSRAAIEWVNSVRLATQMIDPDIQVRVEFINAHEGSLSLNNSLDWGETQLEKIPRPRLTATAVGLALFLLTDAGPVTDYWFGAPDEIELNADDRALLNEILEKISKSDELKKTNRRFFKVISNDPSIKSVGICEKPGEKPAFSVPSSQFGERSGLWEQDNKPEKRTTERVSDVILEGGDLSEADRVWRFLDVVTGIPFSAKMRDEVFVQSLRGDGINENIRTGIEMKIQIKFKEELIDGAWRSIPSTIEVMKVTLS
jgi:hypothetical protein